MNVNTNNVVPSTPQTAGNTHRPKGNKNPLISQIGQLPRPEIRHYDHDKKPSAVHPCQTPFKIQFNNQAAQPLSVHIVAASTAIGKARIARLGQDLRTASSVAPLRPSNQHAEDANSVYATAVPGAIFKPSHEAAVKAKTSCHLLQMVGLENSIPESDHVTVPQVIDRVDIGKEYIIIESKGQRFLVSDRYRIPDEVETTGNGMSKTYIMNIQGKTYEFSPNRENQVEFTVQLLGGDSDDEGDEGDIRADALNTSLASIAADVEFDELLDDTFVLIARDSKKYFAHKEGMHVITKGADKLEYVTRGDQQYRVLPIRGKSGSFEVVGKDVQGLIQLKVGDLFGHDRTIPLDLRDDTPAVRAMINRLDTDSFTDAFLATMLLRLADGKIGNLKECNYLFSILPNAAGQKDARDPNCKLQTVLIDLDEALPAVVDVNPPGPKQSLHPVRNGLMGLPQARRPLTGAHKAHAIEVIERMAKTCEGAAAYLEHVATDGPNAPVRKVMHATAYKETVRRFQVVLQRIKDQDFTLEQLMFGVFPNYAKAWDEIGDRSAMWKAEQIGFMPQTAIMSMLRRTASDPGQENRAP